MMCRTQLLLAVLVTSTNACMKTIPTDPPVDPPVCNLCRADTVTLTSATGPLTTTPTKEVVPVNAQGCQQMRVTCRSPNGNSFMKFNGAINGPSGTPVVTALLVCRHDRGWYYTEGGVSSAVTEISCAVTAEPVRPCAKCDPSTVTFHPATAEDETDAIRQDLANNAQGCKRMNAICRSGSATDDSFMEFNLGIGGPYIAPTVTAMLTCRADQQWYYTDGTTSLPITDVSCSTTKAPAETCATCDPSAVTFLTATTEDETDAIMETLANNPQGCRQMNAVCRSGSAQDSFMEFNGAVGGPDVAPTVTALLTCRADQQWYFTDGTSSLAVKDVGCNVIPEEEEECSACDEAAVTFHMKTLPEEVDAMKETLINDGNGCKQMNAICKASAGKTAFMEFNDAIGGPVIAETVTSLLTCRDDKKWYFTSMGTSIEVTKVRCTEASG